MARVLLVFAAVGLAVYALVDMANSDEARRGGLPRGLWVVLIIFLPYVGPIAWILTGFTAQSSGAHPGGTPSGGRPAGRRVQPGPMAPDDDPDFLWKLDQQRRTKDRSAETEDHKDDPRGG